ncbi:MAG: sugar ABC transporter permease [Clostridia bacterium]|nr:sugar ABC transporter permease [Clostridia bacterium]
MQKAKKVGLGQNNAKSRLFYTLLVLLPSIQFLIFYVYVNFNTIILAFTKFTLGEADGFTFNNFKHWFTSKHVEGIAYNDSHLWGSVGVALKSYVISFCTGVPLGLFFSYYMFKKMPGAGAFRILLFTPSILSATPLAIIFVQLTESVIGNGGWLEFKFWSLDHQYFSMMFFCIFTSFGTSVLMYTNKMDSIAPEIIESAHLDGANGIKEFWYIVLPQAFSIVQVFLMTGFAGMFTNQYNAFTLFSWTPPDDVTTLGMLLWNGVRKANESQAALGPYAALGLLVTIVVVPLTFLLRWALDKFGWKEE